MKNIFENAKFGDKFLTRDGTVVIYISPYTEVSIYDKNIKTTEHTYAIPGKCSINWCNNDGINCSDIEDWDIVSRYEETISFGECISNKELQEKLKEFPDDATVSIEYCNVKNIQYRKSDNLIIID